MTTSEQLRRSVPQGTTAPVVSLRGLTKGYAGVLAVDHVSFDIMPGEVLGLVGKNGAGKSTLIKILAGVVRRDEGVVSVDGDDVEIHHPWEAERLGIFCIHQDIAVVGDLSVAENIALGHDWPRQFGGVHHAAVRARATELLEQLGEVGIDPRALVKTLSPARQRMVSVARALWSRPKVVILDEPTASLSVTEVEEIHRLVRHLRRDGIAVVFVSHRLEEVLELCDAVVVMRDGVFEGRHDREQLSMPSLVGLISGRAAGATESSPRAKQGQERTGHDPSIPALLSVDSLSGPGVHEVSLRVRPGEILGLGGLVGSGRTELLRLVAGAAVPTSGRVEVSGRAIRQGSVPAAIEAGLVLLPEDRKGEGVIGAFSVQQNLTLAALPSFRRLPWVPVTSQRRERVAVQHYRESLDIKFPRPGSPIGSLSGGNQQKVLLARWLVKGATVFLCDEPTQGVDVDGKDDIGRQLRAIADAGHAVVLVSSDLPELVAWSDRVVVMREGRVAGHLEHHELDIDRVVDLCFGTATRHLSNHPMKENQ